MEKTEKTKRKQWSHEEKMKIGQMMADRGERTVKDLATFLNVKDFDLYRCHDYYKAHTGHDSGSTTSKPSKSKAMIPSEDKDGIIAQLRTRNAELESDVDYFRGQLVIAQKLLMAVGKTLE